MAGADRVHMTWRRESDRVTLNAAQVTGDYFRALGLGPAVGRLLASLMPAKASSPSGSRSVSALARVPLPWAPPHASDDGQRAVGKPSEKATQDDEVRPIVAAANETTFTLSPAGMQAHVLLAVLGKGELSK
jgi:hypothetical protein